MKSLFILAAMTFSFSSHASYFQTDCQNSDGTILSAGGHGDNFIKVAQYNSSGKITKIVELDLIEKVDYEYLDTKELSKMENGGCSIGQEIGFWEWETTYSAKMVITNRDGSLFDKYLAGVSKDLKSIESDVICESKGNSMVLCDNN